MDFVKVKEALDEFERTEPGHVDLINDARKELAELEKQTDEDARSLAKKIESGAHDYAEFWCHVLPQWLEEYAESYAVRRCHTCPKLKNALDTHIRDRDAEIERIAENA